MKLPPMTETNREIIRLVRTLEQQKARRRKIAKDLKRTDGEIWQTSKLLRQFVAKVSPQDENGNIGDLP